MTNNGSWLKFLFMGCAVFLGGSLGLYLATDFDGPVSLPSSCPNQSGFKTEPISFPLEHFDVKDTQERPTIAVDDKKRVYVAWASQTGESEKKLFLAKSDDNGESFSKAREILKSAIFKSISQMKGKTISRDVRMTPHLIAGREEIFLAWTEALPDLNGVRMVVSSSRDGGEIFGDAIPVHHGENARATFTSISLGQEGSMVSSWLDNRGGRQKTFASVKGPSATVFPLEEMVAEGDPEKGVCPCCPTTSIVAPDGTIYVAFRNIRDGYRDFYISRKKPGAVAFEVPVPVVPPTWKFDGCPHDGASMVLVGDILHITWMDARTGSQRCYHAYADANTMKFKFSELHAISQGSQGNARLVLDSQSNVHAVWEETKDLTANIDANGDHKHEGGNFNSGAGRNIMVGAFDKNTSKWGMIRPVHEKSGVFQTRPAIAVAGDGDLLVAWNELSESGKAIKFKKIKSGVMLVKDSKP